jgi:hypothetical protein
MRTSSAMLNLGSPLVARALGRIMPLALVKALSSL